MCYMVSCLFFFWSIGVFWTRQVHNTVLFVCYNTVLAGIATVTKGEVYHLIMHVSCDLPLSCLLVLSGPLYWANAINTGFKVIRQHFPVCWFDYLVQKKVSGSGITLCVSLLLLVRFFLSYLFFNAEVGDHLSWISYEVMCLYFYLK